jgi:hypothetical protein
MADVQATVEVLHYKTFWKNCDKCIYKVNCEGAVVGVAPKILCPNDNSDTNEEKATNKVGGSISDDEESDSEINDNSNEENNNINNLEEITNNPTDVNTGWQLDVLFKGIDTSKRFEDILHTRSNQRKGDIVTGIKVLKSSENSTAKAWRLLMTNGILEEMVDYSNDNGKLLIGTGSFSEITNLNFLILFVYCSFLQSKNKRKKFPIGGLKILLRKIWW